MFHSRWPVLTLEGPVPQENGEESEHCCMAFALFPCIAVLPGNPTPKRISRGDKMNVHWYLPMKKNDNCQVIVPVQEKNTPKSYYVVWGTSTAMHYWETSQSTNLMRAHAYECLWPFGYRCRTMYPILMLSQVKVQSLQCDNVVPTCGHAFTYRKGYLFGKINSMNDCTCNTEKENSHRPLLQSGWYSLQVHK